MSDVVPPVFHKRWISAGAWALTDQSLFALSNFAVNIFLARHLGPTEYGAFALAFAVFLLLGTLHNALLAEPMAVFASARYKERFSEYLEVLIQGHWFGTVLSGCILAAAGVIVALMGSPLLGQALISFGLASPFILFQWLMRRACYAQLRPQWSAAAGTIYMVLVAGGAIALYVVDGLSVITGVALLAIASLVSGSLLVVRLGLKPSLGIKREVVRPVANEHWNYGRWSIASSAVGWIPGNAAYFILTAAVGLESTAAFRALMNVLLPVQHVLAALGALLVPILTRYRSSDAFNRITLHFLQAFGALTLLTWLAVGVFAEPLVAGLYAQQYVQYARLLWLLGLLPIIAGQQAVLSAVLRALERPDLILRPYVASAVVAVAGGLTLTLLLGLWGAAIGLLLSTATSVAGMTWYVRRPNHPTRLGQPSSAETVIA